jgi:iron complex transport system ATP-binding protein
LSLIIENLSVRFGRRRAVSEVTVDAAGGKIICVLGPNGSGKTTLLRTIAGLLRPSSGDVRFAGSRLDQLPPRVRAARVSWVPARSFVAGGMTLEDVVTQGRYALGPSARRIDEAIAAVDLDDRRGDRWHALSAGMRQRSTLARALAQRSPGGLFLLDEPTSALDLRHVRGTVDILKQCASEGDLVLCAVHDLDLANEMAADVWVLDEGRLVIAGSADAVLSPGAIGAIFGIDLDWAVDGGGDRHLVRPATTDR